MSRPRGTVDRRRQGVWRLRAESAPDPVTGQRQRVTRTVYVSGKRQAQQELVKLLGELGRKPRTGTTKAKTVADACDAWLTMFDALVAAGKKSPATAERFRNMVEWYIVPAIGARTLRDLTTEQINALYLRLLTKGKPIRIVKAQPHGRARPPRPLSAATVQKTHVALSLALGYAVKLGWLDANPAEKAVRPQSDTEDRPVVAPALESVLALLTEAQRVDPEWAAYIRLSASLGTRRGETAGLRWSVVNLDAGTVTLATVVSIGADGPVLRDRPKTKRGVRQVALDRGSIDVLRAQRVRQMERAFACGVKLVKDPFVFASDIRGSEPVDPQVMTHRFMRLRDRLGLEVRLHDLRHHVATQLLAAGVDVVTVAGRLGQDPSVTLRTYSHFVPARDRAAAEIMAAILDGAPDAQAR